MPDATDESPRVCSMHGALVAQMAALDDKLDLVLARLAPTPAERTLGGMMVAAAERTAERALGLLDDVWTRRVVATAALIGMLAAGGYTVSDVAPAAARAVITAVDGPSVVDGSEDQ